jgi:hypothetical protein
MIKQRLPCRTATSVPGFEVWKCAVVLSPVAAPVCSVSGSRDTQPHRGTVPAGDHPVPVMFDFVNPVDAVRAEHNRLAVNREALGFDLLSTTNHCQELRGVCSGS